MRFVNGIILVILLVLIPSSPSIINSGENSENYLRPSDQINFENLTLANLTYDLQKAIDNASSGEIIELPFGNIIGDVIIDKEITLQGEGIDMTNIDANGSGPVIKIISNNVSLMDLTISNSSKKGLEIDDVENISLQNIRIHSCEDALLINDCRNITLKSCMIYGNTNGIASISTENIEVANSTFYNMIRSFKIENGMNYSIINSDFVDCEMFGLYVSKCSNISIDECSFSSSELMFFLSEYSSLNNSYIFNSTDHGVVVDHCENIVIQYCNITNNYRNGIFLNHLDGGRISNCFISNHSFIGIYLFVANEVQIIENTINISGQGIVMSYSSNLTLNLNILYNTSFLFSSHLLFSQKEYILSIDMNENFVNNKPVLLLKGVNNLSIRSDFGQLIIVNSSNIVISDLSINNCDNAIQVIFSNSISIVDSRFIGLHSYTIDLLYSKNIRANNCTFQNVNYGIKIFECTDFIMEFSIFRNNNFGIYGSVVHGDMIVQHCDFVDNNQAAFFHNSDETVIAEYNWWGDPSGPYNELSNPTGKGDSVSDGVDFIPFLFKTYKNTPPILDAEINNVTEDEYIEFEFYGYDSEEDTFEWMVNTNADFLVWNSNSKKYYGVPLNKDVGECWIDIKLIDERSAHTHRNFSFNVVNNPPMIISELVTEIHQDSLYLVDFNSTDDLHGMTSWSMVTNASWLNCDETTGVLKGIPKNKDAGIFWSNISVDDGNGGLDWTNFTLIVLNVNDDPEIIEFEIEDIKEHERFYHDFDAIDIDSTDDTLLWEMNTSAEFLHLNQTTGNISGIPKNDDVGTWWVNISVSDGNGGKDWRNFTINVLNTNDGPQMDQRNVTFTMEEDSQGVSFDMKDYVYDIDGDIPTYVCLGSKLNFTENDGVYHFIPKANWCGTDIVSFLAMDGIYVLSFNFTFIVTPVNDAPTDVQIISESSYFEGGNQWVNSTAFDVDIPFGDTLSYKWSSNITGEIGNGRSINLSLRAGHHLITLNVTDEEGLSSEATMKIQILPLLTNKPSDNEREFPIIIAVLIGILLIAIIGLIIFIVMRRKSGENSGEISDEVSGEGSEVSPPSIYETNSPKK